MTHQLSNYNSPDYVWKALLAEFLGTFVLVLVVCLAVALLPNVVGYPQSANEGLAGGLTYGLAFMALIYALGSYSGAHLNPAISFGFAVAGRMNWLLLLGYWLAQFLGAIAAAALVMYFVSGVPEANGMFGSSIGYLTNANSGAAFLLEAFLTFILVLVVLFVTKNPFISLMGGLAIGLVLTFEYLAAAPLTGASMNPARSLGPAIFSGQWGSYWIYILGPLVGALVAALIFKLFDHDWSATDKKDDCGKPLKDACGNVIKERKVPVLDDCGNKIKDCDGKAMMETVEYVPRKLGHHQEMLPQAIGYFMTACGLQPHVVEKEFKVAMKTSHETHVEPTSPGLVGGVVQGTGDVVKGVVQGTGQVVGGVLQGTGQVVGGVVRGTGTAVKGVGQGIMSMGQGFTGQGVSSLPQM